MEEEEKKRRSRWVDCDVEVEYFGENRKINKLERKKKKAQDRSKFKKTDQDQQKKLKEDSKPKSVEGERGRVLSITPQGIIVEIAILEKRIEIMCQLKGALKKEKQRLKNLVTIGDLVWVEVGQKEEGTIVSIEERRSFLSRADNLSRNKEQLIASNIDQVLITASLFSPELKPNLIDRYIIAAMRGNMKPIIVINKVDLLEEEKYSLEQREAAKELLDEVVAGYKAAAIEVISVSVEKNINIDLLKQLMKDKASVFSGQSGVGKSSLINAIAGQSLRVGGIVERTNKGSHTTTKAELLPLSFGGWCIDTPGIKSFGIWNISENEIEPYFPEIHALAKKCYFQGCTHTHEQNCNVLKVLEKGKLSQLRYFSYVSLRESLEQEHKRR